MTRPPFQTVLKPFFRPRLGRPAAAAAACGCCAAALALAAPALRGQEEPAGPPPRAEPAAAPEPGEDWGIGEEPGSGWADDFGEDRVPDGSPFEGVPTKPTADAADAAPAVTVPGAASVEPVLRAVYRPHPSRVREVYEFLNAHAAAGVTVSLRPSTAEDANAGTSELVVVAPEPAQRALGAFLVACVSAEPRAAGGAGGDAFERGERYRRQEEAAEFTVPEDYTDPPPGDFQSARPTRGDDFDSDNLFDDAFDRPGDDFGPFADSPAEAPLDDRAFEDDFGDDAFGDAPARTTRRPPPRRDR